MSTRTRRIAVRAAAILGAVYVALVLAMRHPLQALAFELGGVLALWLAYVVRFAWNSPHALAPELAWFRLKDRLWPPGLGRVVFIGSSTIAHWRSLARDFAPLRVLGRGINGARVHQLAYYIDALALRHAPSAIVIYAGENDIAGFLGSRRLSPDEVIAEFRRLWAKIRARCPDVTIYVLALKPPRRRAAFASEMHALNVMLGASCARDPRMHFIDATSQMVDELGRGREDLFERDGVHLADPGYAILCDALKLPLEADAMFAPVPPPSAGIAVAHRGMV